MMRCQFDSSLSFKDMLGLQRDLMMITSLFSKEHFVLSWCFEVLRSVSVALHSSLAEMLSTHTTAYAIMNKPLHLAIIEHFGSVELEPDGSCRASISHWRSTFAKRRATPSPPHMVSRMLHLSYSRFDACALLSSSMSRSAPCWN